MHLPHKYSLIQAWGDLVNANDSDIDLMQQLAASNNAPLDTVCFNQQGEPITHTLLEKFVQDCYNLPNYPRE